MRDKSLGLRHMPLFGFGFGWFFYLVKGYSPRGISHINPWAPIFVKNTIACLISIICCATVLISLLAVYATFGLSYGQFVVHYIMPIFVFATWLVVTTFLHHQVS